MTLFLFFLTVVLIGCSGFWLSRSADNIGDALGLSENWIGAVMLATITSSPELISGITAVSPAVNLPEMAVGNVFGGNVFNLFFVVALDLFFRERSIYSQANFGHVLTASLGVLMMGAVLFLFVLQTNMLLPTFGAFGAGSFLLLLLYLLCMRTIHHFEEKSNLSNSRSVKTQKVTPRIIVIFILSCLGVIIGGLILPNLGDRIITEFGLNQAFVGTVFMALATSSPEIAVCFAALRLKLVNMAFSTLLASNIFNMVIIFVDDIFYVGRPIFFEVSIGNILTLCTGILMTALVLVGLVYNPEKKVLNTVSGISLLILSLYLLNNFALYRLGEK